MKDDFLTRLKAERKRSGKDFSDIPENYFEKLKFDLLNKVERKSRKTKLYRKRILGLAASVLILVGLFYIWQFANNANNLKQNYEGYAAVKDSMIEKSTTDTIPYFEQTNAADSLLLDEIPKEYLIQYLLEYEEFEF